MKWGKIADFLPFYINYSSFESPQNTKKSNCHGFFPTLLQQTLKINTLQ